jgi:hypothetical protein
VYRESVVITKSGASGQSINWIGSKAGSVFQTIIDPSEDITSGWSPAPEAGSSMIYKRTFPYAPGVLVDASTDRQIPQVNPWGGAWEGVVTAWPGAAWNLLAYPPNAIVTHTLWRSFKNYFWDNIKCAYAYWNGITYLRYRNGDDPNTKTIRASVATKTATSSGNTWIVSVHPGGSIAFPVGASVRVLAAYNTVRDLHVRGSNTAVAISGAAAHHNRVEGCWLRHGHGTMHINTGAHSNVVIGCDSSTGRTFDYTGAYIAISPTTADFSVVNQKFYAYRWSKSYESATETPCIVLGEAGNDNQVLNNHVHSGNTGISLHGGPDAPAATTGTVISGNSIDSLSSGALILYEGDRNTRVHDNVMTDVNFGFRLQNIQTSQVDGPRQQFIYRNVISLPQYYGIPIFFHNLDSYDGVPEIWIYHNTFHGGWRSFSFSPVDPDTGVSDIAYKATRIFNNVLLCETSVSPSGPTDLLQTASDSVALFDYNFYRGTVTRAWSGGNNIQSQSYLWPFLDPSVGVIDKTFPVWERGRNKVGTEPDSAAKGFTAWDIGSHEFSGVALDPPVFISYPGGGFAFEEGLVPASIRIHRLNSTALPLTVAYSISGTAIPGLDYAVLSGTVTLLSGNSSADVVVQPVHSAAPNDRTVVLALSPGVDYTVSSPSTATIVIRRVAPVTPGFIPPPGQRAVRRVP